MALSNADLPFWQRIRPAIWIELKLLRQLAAPAVFVYMVNYVLSMSTRILAGHLGNLDLAAASLGNSGIQSFAYGLMQCESKQRARSRASKVSCIFGSGGQHSLFHYLCGVGKLVMVFRNVISYAFTEGEAVANAVSDLCPLLVITLLLNGIQPVLSGELASF
ncbi:hypothetical protein C3L33_10182, partial [Rhododendron williamsianum]